LEKDKTITPGNPHLILHRFRDTPSNPHFLVIPTKFCYIFRSPKPLIRNQVRHLLIILFSFLLLSSPVIG